jgi:Delta7-sterol 5-desaturase
MPKYFEYGYFELWLFIILGMSARYFIVCLLANEYFYNWGFKYWQKYLIQGAVPQKKFYKEEIKISLIAIVVFGAMGSFFIHLGKWGVSKVYFDFDQHSKLYFFGSFFVFIILYDFYFYFTHRLLHTKWFYKNVHYAHHVNPNPSALSSIAFHPVEAFLNAIFILGYSLLTPVHPHLYILIFGYITIINTIGHVSVEVYPKILYKLKFHKVFNFATHHNMHHRYYNCNYGLALAAADRIFKTMHKNYEEDLKKNI